MTSASSKIFVVGASRSGTTMLARMLGTHSMVHMFKELHFFERLVSGEEFEANTPFSPERSHEIAALLVSVIEDGFFAPRRPEAYRDLTRDILGGDPSLSPADIFDQVTRFYRDRAGARAICEQTPRNVFYIREIRAKYPDAVFIHMVRDPRAVLLSQKNKWRLGLRKGSNVPLFETIRSWCNYHPLVTTRLWRSAVMAGLRDDPAVLTVQYESVATDPEAMLRRICDHCGLDFEAEMLAVSQIGSSGRTDTTTTGVDGSRVDAWRQGGLNPAEIAICEQQAGPVLDRLGYEPIKQSPSLILLGWTWALLPFKAVAALATNLSRARSLVSWARKRLG